MGPVLLDPPDVLAAGLRAEAAAAVGRTTGRARKVGLMLSSGVDSAVLLAAIKDLGKACTAFTLSYGGSHGAGDLEVSARIAAQEGVRQRRVDVASIDDATFSEMFRQLDEPLEASRGPTQLLLARAAAEDGVDACLNGVSGENVYGGMAWRPFAKARAATDSDLEAVDRLLCRTTLLKPETQAALLAGALPHVEIERRILRPFDALVDIDDPYEKYNASLLLRVPTGRHGVPSLLIPPAHGVEMRQGLRDQQLVDFGRRLPFELKEGGAESESRRLVRLAYGDRFPHLLDNGAKYAMPGMPLMEPGLGMLRNRAPSIIARLETTGLFRPEALQKLLAKALKPHPRSRAVLNLWTLVCFQIWHDLKVARIDPFT
jgi:asparagine synthetase B (glutamine-hydrolysing)